MEIHWLADAAVAGAFFGIAWWFWRIVWPQSRDPAESIRRSRLKSTLDGAGIGVFTWEISGDRFICDRCAAGHVGAPAHAALSRESFLQRLAEEERDRVRYRLDRAGESNQKFVVTARLVEPDADGDDRYIELWGEPEGEGFRAGSAARFFGAMRNVTLEHRRSAELRRQSQVLAQVHDAIVATTLDGRILTWNPGAERTYGYPAQDAVGKKLEILWFRSDREEMAQQVSAASVASGAHEFVSRVRHRSGAELYVHFRLAMLRGSDGADVGLLACSHDVTRQREEHELLSLQASALESIADSVLVTDKHGMILHSNQAASGLFRVRAGLAGQPISALLAGSAERRDTLLSEIRTTLATNRRWAGELDCLRRGDPEPILTRASVTVLDLASGPNWVWVQQDITKQRSAEAALRERERRFRNLADTAPMMVWMTDREGDCEYVNDAWLAHTGMTRDEAVGAGWQDAFHPADRLELLRLIDCRTPGRGPFELELRTSCGNGRIAYTLTRGAPRYEAGRIVGYIGSAVDITGIKRAEQDRIALEQQALKAQKLHSLGVLAGGIAHDFNNLLVSVLGFSDLALHELEPRHPARELVEQIEVGSRRAAALVQQVLTFAGKAQKSEEEVDINDTVVEMASLLERTVGAKVSFDLDLASGLPQLTSDPAQMSQVVMNLVLNASDALGDRGGRIRVRTKLLSEAPNNEAHWIGADTFTKGRYLQLEVHDSGCGMDDDTLSQIFDPFFTTKVNGRGLGLSAVMGVVRSYAGAISVESALGEGSSFRVVFPLSPAPADLPVDPPVADTSTSGLLVVDDDPTVLQATRQMLQSCGLKVFCAQSELEAEACFRLHALEIGLVLLDVVMPATTPMRIADNLNAIQPVRILLTSGFSETGERPAIDNRTFVGFIPKPYDRAQLLEAVGAVAPSIIPERSGDAASA